MILTSDWHLTDNPADEYRWEVFGHLFEYCQDCDDGDIFILGDIADRKDHHSGALLNRMLHEFQRYANAGLQVHAIMGNHDYPLKGTPYWSVLNTLAPRVQFHVKPYYIKQHKLWLLPYTPKPEEDWKAIDWGRYDTAFIHQPVNNAILESGRKLTSIPALPLPHDIKIWAGDIHTPQKIGRLDYVGAPHPVDFGDDYDCRFVQLDHYCEYADHQDLAYMRKAMLDFKSLKDLEGGHDLSEGDQAKVRMVVDPKRIGQWPADRLVIQEWAKKLGVTLASIEAVVTFTLNRRADIPDIKADLEQVFKAYCEEEGLKGETVEVGLDILRDDTDD